MRGHATDPAVQAAGCRMLAVFLCASSRGGVADGAVAAVVNAMRTHAADATLQLWAVNALSITLFGNAAAQSAAADAGAIGAVLSAVRTHVGDTEVLTSSFKILTCMAGCARRAGDNGSAARELTLRTCGAEAVDGGALELLAAAMRAHKRDAIVQARGLGVLCELLYHAMDGATCAASKARVKAVMAAAAPRVLRAALDAAAAHLSVADVQLNALCLLEAIATAGLAATAASDGGAHAGTRRMLLASVAAMRAHPADEQVQMVGCSSSRAWSATRRARTPR
jgi:hypothetical protein